MTTVVSDLGTVTGPPRCTAHGRTADHPVAMAPERGSTADIGPADTDTDTGTGKAGTGKAGTGSGDVTAPVVSCCPHLTGRAPAPSTMPSSATARSPRPNCTPPHSASSTRGRPVPASPPYR
ncbi:hypothetical protein [Streptomyces sp. NPDC051776]|uniref:hypothetical protein n=1 Tax=Streptomyces sp. NPDC051776 TaxID=3155414 RepID=UPI0034268AE2